MIRHLSSSIAFLCVAMIADAAIGGTIIKTTAAFENQIDDFQFDQSTFSTIGNVSTGINFSAELDSFQDIVSGASINLAGINPIGDVMFPFPGVILQKTNGGSFSIFDGSDELLSGQIGEGSLTGQIGGSTGHFRTTTDVIYDSGTALQTLLANGGSNRGSLSVSLTQITGLAQASGPAQFGGPIGFSLNGSQLLPFQANLTANLTTRQIAVPAVPEPASIVAFAVLLCGIFVGTFRRRRATSVA